MVQPADGPVVEDLLLDGHFLLVPLEVGGDEVLRLDFNGLGHESEHLLPSLHCYFILNRLLVTLDQVLGLLLLVWEIEP